MRLGEPLAKELMISGSCWKLQISVNAFSSYKGNDLSTQVKSGRGFQIINNQDYNQSEIIRSGRLKVRLLEDGYTCWLEVKSILNQAVLRGPWKPDLFDFNEINLRIPSILQWIERASVKTNKYLWGGTLGPDFDCSGLVQSAFASQEIWLPRDAYQQEMFCQDLMIDQNTLHMLKPGDLIFFGTPSQCDHVGIYLGCGQYWHSSGKSFGRDGIGRDSFFEVEQNSIAAFYLSKLRGAGRVVRCHDGSTIY